MCQGSDRAAWLAGAAVAGRLRLMPGPPRLVFTPCTSPLAQCLARQSGWELRPRTSIPGPTLGRGRRRRRRGQGAIASQLLPCRRVSCTACILEDQPALPCLPPGPALAFTTLSAAMSDRRRADQRTRQRRGPRLWGGPQAAPRLWRALPGGPTRRGRRRQFQHVLEWQLDAVWRQQRGPARRLSIHAGRCAPRVFDSRQPPVAAQHGLGAACTKMGIFAGLGSGPSREAGCFILNWRQIRVHVIIVSREVIFERTSTLATVWYMRQAQGMYTDCAAQWVGSTATGHNPSQRGWAPRGAHLERPASGVGQAARQRRVQAGWGLCLHFAAPGPPAQHAQLARPHWVRP